MGVSASVGSIIVGVSQIIGIAIGVVITKYGAGYKPMFVSG